MYIDKFLRLRQLSPGEDGGGIPPKFISLEDIDEIDPAEEEKQKAADLEKAAKEQEQKDKEATDAQKAIDDAAEEAKKGTKLEEKPEDKIAEEEDSEGEDDNFWADVDKLRGEAIDVDFGEVDPTSPEGVLIYEKAVRLDEISKFESYLETTYPRAYAYLTHMLDGGKEEDFFKIAGEPATLPTEQELENSVELQKDIVTRNLKAKGNNDKAIDRIIKGSIADDDLEELAKDALKEEAKREQEGIELVRKQSEADVKLKNEKIAEMSNYVSNIVATGKIDNIIIPEKDRAEFAKAFASSIRIENGKFVSVTEVGNDNINKLMKEKFFSFKNGDLTALIEKAAATANTKRLQRNIQTTQKKPLGSGQKQEGGLSTLSEMDD